MSGITQLLIGGSYGTVPGAPTIGTATATSSTTATVTYTAPANNGGLPITSYTATSSPGGITGTLGQAGSGVITINGLTAGTSYTFTVYATNAKGNSPSSAASNSITTPLPAPTSLDVMTVAGGGGGSKYSAGGGAGGVLVTTLSVTSGVTYSIGVGGGGAAGVRCCSFGYWFTGCNGGNSCISGSAIAYGGGGGGGGPFRSKDGGSGAGGPGFSNRYCCYGAQWAGGSGVAGQGNAGAGTFGYCCHNGRRGGGGGGGGRAGGPYFIGFSCCIPIYGGAVNTGGIGTLNSYSTGSNAYYGGGGGGGRGGQGGAGGGGNGANINFCCAVTPGGTNTGGGGGAGAMCYPGPQSGGSGIVVIRYLNTKADAVSTTGSVSYLNSGGYKRYTFYGSGSIRW